MLVVWELPALNSLAFQRHNIALLDHICIEHQCILIYIIHHIPDKCNCICKMLIDIVFNHQMTHSFPPGSNLIPISLLSKTRAYADAGPSVRNSQPQNGDGDFVRATDSGSEKSVEASSSDDEAKNASGEGKKKKQRSGFRDRKVINNRPIPPISHSPV